jgi:hypothetical protein
VAYTDGLIGRPEESIDVGLERLTSLLAARDAADVDRLAEEMLGMLAPGPRRDDAAVVVVRSTDR